MNLLFTKVYYYCYNHLYIELAESAFNPYQASFNSLSTNSSKTKEISNETNFDELIQAELGRREQIIKNAKIERDPKCYKLSSTFTINNMISQMNEKSTDELSTEEDRKLLKKQIELIKSKESDRFTLKSRTSFEALIKRPIYVKSDIRLIFPEEIIIEASFGLKETIQDIYTFIKTYLKNPNDKFVISTSPPPKKYNQLNLTIKELNLYPKVIMYVNFDDGKNEKLKKEKLNLPEEVIMKEEESL